MLTDLRNLTVDAVDYHTCGEPFRIVTDPPYDFPGRSVNERCQNASDSPEANFLRLLLALEPRGHRDMFGGFVVPPDDDGAHFGVLFWSQQGFATACGHGTMALGTWAIESGLVAPDPSGVTDVIIDVPSGRVIARVHSQSGSVTHVDFVNVASFVHRQDVCLQTSFGDVSVDIAYGGAMYAHVNAAELGLTIDASNTADLVRAGVEIRNIIQELGVAVLSANPRVDDLCGVIIFECLDSNEDGDLVQRNILVYGDAQVDRSPCGSGTSSRLAVLHATGDLTPPRRLVHRSIIDSTFIGAIVDATEVDGRPAVFPVVTGQAHRTGAVTFGVDPNDAFLPGFRL